MLDWVEIVDSKRNYERGRQKRPDVIVSSTVKLMTSDFRLVVSTISVEIGLDAFSWGMFPSSRD